MPVILGIDPGGTTGISLIEFTPGTEPKLLATSQVGNGLKGFLRWHKMATYRWDFVVCESFTLRPGIHGVDITPAYVIGALEALENPRSKIHFQPPSSKPLCDDDTLKRLGLYTKAYPHSNDATRHAIIYLRNVRHMPTLRKGWPE